MATVSRNVSVKSTSPEIIKKIEQEIVKEAKNEERSLKDVVKDLHRAEKDTNKAHKSAVKAEKALEKAEKREQKTLKNLYRAENAHNIALGHVTHTQHEFELATKKHTKMRELLQAKTTRVDEAMKANDEHTKTRNARLAALQGPSATEEAARVVPDPTSVPPKEVGTAIPETVITQPNGVRVNN
ncbi:hypothetical protein JR316_0004991 [Psilocybe cubensis]|uniref:Uncharacterized protein n=2 Tax=Psilocybe cubensis TaxID=181762 RepID=A0A8H7Y0W9_PSICU|nr:hypothetical protein JR316_0004991 [Psilocybe cubensis]KAH9482891.1 hypothetical protein JR316_0004991 [Psilocybe cubensis]